MLASKRRTDHTHELSHSTDSTLDNSAMDDRATSLQPSRPAVGARKCSAHAYAYPGSAERGQETTPSQLEAGIQEPEAAHIPRSEQGLPLTEGIITVAPSRRASRYRLQRPPQAERGLSDFSIASSGTSITEGPAPEAILKKVESEGPGTYRYIITNISDHTSSFDSVGSRLEKSISIKFELERLDCADDHIVTKERLQQLADDFPMPKPKHGETYNKMRYHHFAVYQRLFAVVLGFNIALIATFAALTSKRGGRNIFDYGDALNAVATNVIAALLMRQEHCINVVFRILLSLPHSWSLSIRRHAAKVYCYGGIHSACGISALLWYIFFAVLIIDVPWINDLYKTTVHTMSGIVLFCFLILTIASIPSVRTKYHNAWELLHRFVGWFSVAVLWAQLFCIHTNNVWLYNQRRLGIELIKSPSFWMLIVITLLLIYPWLYLRKVYFKTEKLSSHTVRLRMESKKVLPTCSGMSLSDSPFVENHKFATIPEPNKGPGFSIIVANNGDWTKQLCEKPPEYLWTRGRPTLGVARAVTVFRKVVLVATGSGIGPLMSFFNVHPEWHMRIVWSARFPDVSFGNKVMDAILRADKDAVIIDNKKTNLKEKDMPNLVEVAYANYREFEAEAVVVISNPTVTHEVVYSLEKRRVPAYGAIWDS